VTMTRFLFLTIDGLAMGAVYATFALSLVLIWRAARIVNFAQAAISVAAVDVAWVVGSRVGGWWLGLLLAPLVGALLGVLMQRFTMRRLGPERHLDAIIVAIGVAMVVQAGLGMVFGLQYRPLPAPVSQTVLTVGGVPTLSPYKLVVLGAAALLGVGLALLFSRTALGLRLRASALAPEVARLLGVEVDRMTTLAWGLAAGVGAFAALLVLPTGPGLHPTAMDGVFITAFTAAVLGGLDSPVGAVVGGFAVGLVLNYVTGYTDEPNLAPIALLGLLLAVLLVRPNGVFAGPTIRRA
jgi:Branched-chain amino acid ABC-type transport system, permease components